MGDQIVVPSLRDLSPSAAATQVIGQHLVDKEGLLQVPIDPISLAKSLGIDVSLAPLESGVGGLISKSPGESTVSIILNENDPRNRQRFTCAHELGHFFRNGTESEFGFVDHRDDLSAAGVDPRERWANQFAAELLMPAFAVRMWFAEGKSASRMARDFEVSEQAMNIRLSVLGLA